MKTRPVVLGLRTLAAALALAAAGGAFAACDAPLKFGVADPLTGPSATFGIDQIQALKWAVDDINAAGGVNGCKLEPIIVDNQAKPDVAITTTNRFVQIDKVPVMVTAFSNVVKAVAPIAVSEWDLAAIATTACLVFALWGLMTHTRMGKQMTAVADNPELASVYGINVARCYLHSMMLAAVLMVAGAWLIGTKAPIVPSSPLNQFLIFAVIAALLAGVGRVFAAALAAILPSLIQAFSILLIPSRWQIMLVYVLIVVCVLLFPQGVRRRARRTAAAAKAPQPRAEAPALGVGMP